MEKLSVFYFVNGKIEIEMISNIKTIISRVFWESIVALLRKCIIYEGRSDIIQKDNIPLYKQKIELITSD